MSTISGISPAKGSPTGGMIVTVSGAGFLALGSPLAATVEGRPSQVVSASDAAVQMVIPARYNLDPPMGYVRGGGSVDVVISGPSGSVTAIGGYTYTATILERAMLVLEGRVASISVQNGDNFTITSGQIRRTKGDMSLDTGMKYPQVWCMAPKTSYPTSGQNEPYGFYTGTAIFIVSAAFKLDDASDFDAQCEWLARDLTRAILRNTGNNGLSVNTVVDSVNKGRFQDPKAGASASVTVLGKMTIEHIFNEPNSQTEGAP